MLVKRGDESRQLLLAYLKAGEVVVVACDTIYGIVGIAPESGSRIRSIKGRGDTQPFLQLIPDLSTLEKSGAILPDTPILDLWPGPYTFVFSLSGGDTAAFRIPQDAYLRSLLSDLGHPVYSTSVNRTGLRPMDDPQLIESEFGDYLALVEDAGDLSDRKPSTIVDLTVRPYRILRQGAGIVPRDYL